MPHNHDKHNGKELGELSERALAAYQEDLWLQRRLKMDEVVAKLESQPGGNSTTHEAAPSHIRELVKFLRFLENECSGKRFQDDKQWGELMTLMQISRRLNHKSVKFKDILQNRQLIEANAREIRQFNEFVRLCCLIGESIHSFETNLAASHLTLRPLGSGSNDKEQQDGTTLLEPMGEILRAQRHAEATLRLSVNNLRVHLRNELVVQRASASQLETWTKKLNKFELIAGKLCHFLESFCSLKRELSHLRPLVESVASKEATTGTGDQPAQHNNGKLLASSLASCKRNFKQILEFEQLLETNLRSIATRRVESSTPARSSRNSGPQKGSRKASTGSNQQVSASLVKLLKADKGEEFVSELYGSRLDRSLGKAVECRRCLDQMMATLRLEFGRFYFVNDLELLRIISLDSQLARESGRNKRLIGKLFNGSLEVFLLSEAEQQQTELAIVGVETRAGERILLTDAGQEPVPLKKRVNIYSLEIVRILQELMRKLQRSLRCLVQASLSRNVGQNDIDWSLPLQLLDVAERIKFTQRVESALAGGLALDALLGEYETRLERLSARAGDLQTDGLELVPQLKRSAMVSLTVHFISTLLALSRHNSGSSCGREDADNWRWQKLARFYLLPDSHGVEVRIANSAFSYKFDLLPVEQISPSNENGRPAAAAAASVKRLIYTKTSERCFLVASQALGRLKLGACPHGPAGSGKTETVKALGQLLGCQVIVHNCDETNETQALERLIWGLAHTGLWGCFDEFNRLGSSCLSSVSALLELVQTNLRSGRTTLELEDGQIKSIDPASAFFVTLNPGDASEYRGRRRLPANLRSLFLPVAMVQVQVEAIVRELLLSSWSASGRTADSSLAESLGLGLARWLEWMRANLQVTRCEWDLRLAMNILKRFNCETCRAQQMGSLEAAGSTQALVDCVAKEVRPRLERAELRVLEESLRQVFGALSSSSSEQKLQQLADQLETRPGVILLGGCGSGKTKLWQSLAAQRNASGGGGGSKHVSCFVLNPKSCAKSNLFGCYETKQRQQFVASEGITSTKSNKWTDGLLTKLARNSIELLQNKAEVQQVWLVLDGPLDPDWVESLNSVLDDNQVLTLGSGERLNFVLPTPSGRPKCIKLLFETDDVSYVSPATISRLGLVLLEGEEEGGKGRRSSGISSSPAIQRWADGLELTIFKCDQSSCAPPSSLIVANLGLAMEQEAGGAIALEYFCHQGATSVHLLEVLDLIRALGEANTGQDSDPRQLLLLIHNLHLIGEEDRWQTRSFIELLRHLVVSGCYYDSEHNRVDLRDSSLRVAVTTANVGQLGRRFESLARATIDISHPAGACNEDAILSQADWHSTMAQSSAGAQSSILTVKVAEGQVQEAAAKLCDAALGPRQMSAAQVCTFDNSTGIVQSLERLAKFARSRTAVGVENAGQAEQLGRRCVCLLDSIVWPLLSAGQRTEVCHLLNLIKLKRAPPSGLLVALLASTTSGRQPDAFWTQITSGSCFKLQSERLGSEYTEQSVIRSLADRMEGGHSPNLQWLARWMVEHKRPEFGSQWYLQVLARMISSLSGHIAAQKRRLTTCLRRLADFELALEAVKLERSREEQALGSRRREIERVLGQINGDIEQASERSEQLRELKRQQLEKTEQLKRTERQIETELAEVEPLVEASKHELRHGLNPEALNEIKTLRSPPKTIRDILDVLFVLLLQPDPGKATMEWAQIKSYLAKGTLRDELANYNYLTRLAEGSGNNGAAGRANGLEQLLVRVEREIDLRRESFQLDQAARASSAIVPIVSWIQATLKYGRVLAKLSPLIESMRRCKLETAELGDTLARLGRDQQEVDEKIASERQKLAQLEQSYERARAQSARVRLDLERAQEVRSNLGDQVARWQSKLNQYERHLDGDDQQCRVCLACSLLLVGQRGARSSGDLLEQIMGSLAGDDKGTSSSPKQRAGHVANFALNYLAPLVESVDQGDSSSMAEFEFMFSPRQGALLEVDDKQVEHFVKLAVIKLSLNFDQSGRLLLLRVPETLPVERLCKYLSHKRLLCEGGESSLALVRPTTDDHWRRTAELTLQTGHDLVLVDMPPADEPQPNLTLDILDFFRGLRGASGRVILFSRDGGGDGQHAGRLDSCELVTPLDITDASNHHQTRESLESELIDHLVELQEPQLSSSLNELELELKRRQQDARRLESSLIKGLMLGGSREGVASKSSADASLASEGQLVRLLGDLNQSSKALTLATEEIQQKLQDLQAKRTRFARLASLAAAFYLERLADLKRLDYFCHLVSRRFAELLVGFEGNWQLATIERVMCTLRPEERNKRTFGLEQQAVRSLRLAASDLKRQLTILCGGSGLRLAIILHDAKRSSPQMEVDELMRATRDCQYHKLYATAEMSPARMARSRLGAQLERILTSSADLGSVCICIANAHLSWQWLNCRLLEITRRLGPTRRVLIILVGERETAASECDSSQQDDAAGANLLDAAHLKYWHDELALPLAERFRLYSRLRLAGDRLADQLVLFHVACQELLRGHSSATVARWRRAQNYAFDREQLTLSFKLLDQIRDCNQGEPTAGKARAGDERAMLCNHLESIVYGARMETKEDEQLLLELLDNFLRSGESSARKLATFERQLSASNASDGQQAIELHVAELIAN